jgi:hypothetical protein
MKLIEMLAVLKRGPGPGAAAEVDRRASDRVPAQEPAVLCWKDHLELPRSLQVVVVNVSSGGVAFSSCEHLHPGQLISLETGSSLRDCVVRHVRTTGRGYYIGAEIVSRSNGSNMLSSVKQLGAEIGRSQKQ